MKNKLHSKVSVITTVITGALLNWPFGNAVAGANNDTSVCYGAPGVAFILNVKRHSVLVNSAQAARSGQPVQTVYSVHGKYVEGNGFIAPLVGTIIVGSRTRNSNTSGAKLGLTVQSVRGENGQETHFPMTLNCSSDEATPTPSKWPNCFIRDEGGDFSENSTVERIDNPLQNTNCSLFK